MRLPVVDGDLYIRDFELVVENEVIYVVGSTGGRHVLDVPAVERDWRLAKEHGCEPGTCRDQSHTWRARDKENANG